MLYPAVNDLAKKVGNRYSLVIVTAKRARQIVNELEETGEVSDDKPVSTAVHELADDTIHCVHHTAKE
ncbi:MAG: DNA-directed RNA polymerase subunit omega [Eubacteriales bacterium]|jgi:DNA-directed RNA polymerase subunit omega